MELKALKLGKELDALKNPPPAPPPPEPPKKPASRFSKKSTWVSIGVVSVIGGILLMASGIGLVFGAMLLVGGVATLGATGIKTALGKRKEIKAGAEGIREKVQKSLYGDGKQPKGPSPVASADGPPKGPAGQPPDLAAAAPSAEPRPVVRGQVAPTGASGPAHALGERRQQWSAIASAPPRGPAQPPGGPHMR